MLGISDQEAEGLYGLLREGQRNLVNKIIRIGMEKKEDWQDILLLVSLVNLEFADEVYFKITGEKLIR